MYVRILPAIRQSRSRFFLILYHLPNKNNSILRNNINSSTIFVRGMTHQQILYMEFSKRNRIIVLLISHFTRSFRSKVIRTDRFYTLFLHARIQVLNPCHSNIIKNIRQENVIQRDEKKRNILVYIYIRSKLTWENNGFDSTTSVQQ